MIIYVNTLRVYVTRKTRLHIAGMCYYLLMFLPDHLPGRDAETQMILARKGVRYNTMGLIVWCVQYVNNVIVMHIPGKVFKPTLVQTCRQTVIPTNRGRGDVM
mgnify:CR=1 FL=1